MVVLRTVIVGDPQAANKPRARTRRPPVAFARRRSAAFLDLGPAPAHKPVEAAILEDRELQRGLTDRTDDIGRGVADHPARPEALEVLFVDEISAHCSVLDHVRRAEVRQAIQRRGAGRLVESLAGGAQLEFPMVARVNPGCRQSSGAR